MKTYETESKTLTPVVVNLSASTPKTIFKVNAAVVHNDNIIVAGLDSTGKGIANIIVYNNTSE